MGRPSGWKHSLETIAKITETKRLHLVVRETPSLETRKAISQTKIEQIAADSTLKAELVKRLMAGHQEYVNKQAAMWEEVLASGKKKCPRCKEVKSLDAYGKSKYTKHGGQSTCKACHAAYKKLPGKREMMQARARQRAKQPKFIFWRYQKSARLRKLSFELTYEQFMAFWQKPCTYGGCPIETIGLDRIDSSVGYTLANVTPCCGDHNMMKLSHSTEKFIELCRRVVQHNLPIK